MASRGDEGDEKGGVRTMVHVELGQHSRSPRDWNRGVGAGWWRRPAWPDTDAC